MGASEHATEDLYEHYRRVRAASDALARPLSPEDCTPQSMPDASPVKWHLAHTSWFFETFLLEGSVPGYRPFHPEFRVLFNSYYYSVGEQYSRPDRGLVTRPSLAEVRRYREHVDRHVLAVLEKGPDLDPQLASVVEIGLHHEQQHQELMLTDLKHLFSFNPLHPAYVEAGEAPRVEAKALAWHGYEGGTRWIGAEEEGFAFDNERPRHRIFLHEFELASRPVTNGEYRQFVEDGGYEEPLHWLSDGWATVQERDWRTPLYWVERDGAWHEITLSGLRELRDEEPACHLSFYEADAYARWAGYRLPAEAEWEHAASACEIAGGNFVEGGRLHPAAPAAPARVGPDQIFGDVWEWTASAYGPYPGYQPPSGALGEYNGKFMANQMTLRGGSCATPESHIRASYRNFFYPDARWQFSGIRLARDPA